jgi:biotin carboxyl carrier protein
MMEEREKLTEFVIDDCAYLTRLTPKFANRKPTALPDPLAVRAAVPGTVLRLLAEPGQPVRRGQGLVVLEAMKMENALLAPRDGVVKTVHAAPGTRVAKGALLVELAPPAGTPEDLL